MERGARGVVLPPLLPALGGEAVSFVYVDPVGELVTDCPLCGQQVVCRRSGDSYRFECRGGHGDDEVAQVLDPRVMLELGQRQNTAAPVANDKKKSGLGSAPPHGSEVGIVRAFVARGYGIPAGYRIGEVHRHGGLDDTALTVEIVPPGEGKPILIRYDEERLCRHPESLRGQAARDTDGLTRGDLIVGKAAQAMYEALCSLAAIYDRTDPRQLTSEWVQELRAACNPLPGFTLERGARHEALQALRQQPYTRGAVQAAQVAQVRDPDYTPALKPRPPVLVIPAAEGRKLHGHFVACGHLGVFVRHELGSTGTPTPRSPVGSSR